LVFSERFTIIYIFITYISTTGRIYENKESNCTNYCLHRDINCDFCRFNVLQILTSGFFSPPSNVQASAVDTFATAGSVNSLSYSMNDFSFSMYNELGIDSDENVFFSPYSIFVALAMTYEGARSDTYEQMKSVLGFEQNDEVNLCSFGRIYNLLNIDAEYSLNTANALWTKEDYPFLEGYLSFIDNYYMGKATDVDFTNPSEAAEIINSWVEKNTGGKIEDMLSSGDISQEQF